MFSIGFTKTVAVIVGHSHSLFGEDSSEVPFLEFDSISAALFSFLDQFPGNVYISLMIYAYFSNDESGVSVSNGFIS